MNYYKYLLFAILAYAFINYQFNLRTDIIVQIIIGCALIFFVIEYVNINQYTIVNPFDDSKQKKKNKYDDDLDDLDDLDDSEYTDESYESFNSSKSSKNKMIDSDSLELLISDKGDEDLHHMNMPPYLNIN